MVISTAESALSEEIIQNSGLLHPQDYFITSREVRERGGGGGGVGGGMEIRQYSSTLSFLAQAPGYLPAVPMFTGKAGYFPRTQAEAASLPCAPVRSPRRDLRSTFPG